jgi:hypothetical protein
MKLLLDENLPKRLKIDFPEYEIFSVFDMGWSGIKNGKLLTLMLEHGFNVLITFDKNLQHQQNFIKYPVSVLVISANNNTYVELTKYSENIKIFLSNPPLPKGPIHIK